MRSMLAPSRMRPKCSVKLFVPAISLSPWVRAPCTASAINCWNFCAGVLTRIRHNWMASETVSSVDLRKRDEAIEEIASRLKVRAERGRRFAELTSLRVGGAIDWVISPETEEQAAAVVQALDSAGVAWRALGSGSNVLADDDDHHYVVLSLKELKSEPQFEGDRVSVSAGYSLPRLCIDAGWRGLDGIEGLCGMPGIVGGSIMWNAGTFA